MHDEWLYELFYRFYSSNIWFRIKLSFWHYVCVVYCVSSYCWDLGMPNTTMDCPIQLVTNWSCMTQWDVSRTQRWYLTTRQMISLRSRSNRIGHISVSSTFTKCRRTLSSVTYIICFFSPFFSLNTNQKTKVMYIYIWGKRRYLQISVQFISYYRL